MCLNLHQQFLLCVFVYFFHDGLTPISAQGVGRAMIWTGFWEFESGPAWVFVSVDVEW